MSGLDELRDKWLKLVSKGKISEAKELYWQEMFSLIEEKFLDNTNVEEEYDWLILPCGLEASYYILLIKSINPDKVYFIGTKEFKKNFLDKILEKTGLRASQFIVDVIDYEGMDVAEAYKEIRHHLDRFSNKKVIMDLTRGKRILDVGAGIVGAFFGFDLVYIDEDWNDDIKRGIPGSERLEVLRNPFDVFGDLEGEEARELFNNHDYYAAKYFFERLRNRIADPRKIEVNELLSEAYSFWSSFNFRAALEVFEKMLDKKKQYNIKLEEENIKSNYEALKILNSENPDKPQETSDDFAIHLMADLYNNAKRRAESGRYEDAVNRLYRLIELVSQHRLSKHGIDVSNPELAKYEEEYNEITRRINGESRQIPSQIGVRDGHIMLYILEDIIWKNKSFKDLKKFSGNLSVRDTSIVAHGLQLVGRKAYENLKSIAKDFMQEISKDIGKNLSKIIGQHSFVKLKND